MDKWADYLISAVRFNAAHTHIDKVRVHKDNGDSVGAAIEETRADVIASIENNWDYVTIFESNGKWQKGQKVYVIKINGTKFIKTVDNGKAVDNLDDLPEF
jgi:hypothetical protein